MYIKFLIFYLGKILFFIMLIDVKIIKYILFLLIFFKIKMILVFNNKIIFIEEMLIMLKKEKKEIIFILFIEIGILKIRLDWNLFGNDI